MKKRLDGLFFTLKLDNDICSVNLCFKSTTCKKISRLKQITKINDNTRLILNILIS